MGLGDIAAALPWPVFACDKDKRPIVATGFKAASRDPDVIMAQFQRPGAAMIGVPTGIASGLIVIDIDIKNGRDGRKWLNENIDALDQTRTHKTQSGGLHLLFKVPEGVEIRNSASKVAPGVDVRGEGGYVIIPPSPGYAIADDIEPADMPQWLIKACTYVEPPSPPPRSHDRHERYTQSAIDGEIAAVIRATEGTRNDTLNKAAVKLGTLVGAGELSRATAEAELQRAGQMSGLSAKECAQTIKSGLDFGERHPRDIPQREMPHKHTAPPEPPPHTIATPLSSIDLDHIPPRRWLYGRELVRGYVSVLASPGGTGKTAYTLAAGLSVIVNRSLLSPGPKVTDSCKVHKPGKVWFFNLEDPMDEMRRRIKAALQYHKIPLHEVSSRLFIDSGRDTPLVIAKRTASGLVVSPIVDALVQEILDREISVLVVDPFVQSHEAEENRNEEMNFVMSLWGQVAHRGNCAVWLVHHFRKGGKTGDSESIRGAGAIQGAARSMFTIGTMTPEEAAKLGVDEDKRWQYIRHDNAKSNMAPAAGTADWYRLVSVNIGNGDDEYPDGDSVQTVEAWVPPSPWEGLPWPTIECILERIDQGPGGGEYYALGKQARDRWAGRVIMEDAGKTDGQASAILKAWKEHGVIEEGQYASPKQKGALTGCIRVNQPKLSEMRLTLSTRKFDDE